MLRRIAFTGCSLAILVAGCDSTGPRSGSLALTISGLPADVQANVSITGPGGNKLTATGSRTFEDLDPGTYQITASNAVSERSTFAPSTPVTTVEVVSGSPTPAVVSYTVITGVTSFSVTGLPAGMSANISVSSQQKSVSKVITGTGEIGNLPPGPYSITAAAVDAGDIYGAIVSPSSILIAASTTAVPVAVKYGTITGSIKLGSAGLPPGIAATWDITGPNSFAKTVSGTGEVLVQKLQPGQYTVTPRSVVAGGENYGADSGPSFTVSIVAGQTVNATTTFVVRPPTININIDRTYLIQSTQTSTGAVPLIAGRDAYLRVFLKANEGNSFMPDVRVRLYRNGAVVFTQVIRAPRTGVPTSINEAATLDAWATTISGSQLTPGTSILVDVDPDNAVREVNDSDNQFPVDGNPGALDIRTVPAVVLRFVPIAAGDGFIGDVSNARLAELTSLTQRMHPVQSLSADVRAIYTTGLALARSDSNRAWTRILAELDVVRIAEATGRQYVGILRDNGAGSGVAGIGYRPGRTTLSLDENYASEVVAHELGHNWNRLHSPCGGPNGVDTEFPYIDGGIGVMGFDPMSGSLLTPDVPDVMSYCRLNIGFNLSVPRRWTSDFTYTNVMTYRDRIISGNLAVQPSLIVWGRVTDGELVLEPSFIATTAPSLPERRGGLTLDGRDENGNVLYSLSFDPTPVADAVRPEGHFAFAIPLSSVQVDRIARFELRGRGLPIAVQEARFINETPSVTVSAAQPGFVRLRWDAAKTPLLVVRDPVTRQILSLARSGNALVRTSRTSLEVTASNGVQSTRALIRN